MYRSADKSISSYESQTYSSSFQRSDQSLKTTSINCQAHLKHHLIQLLEVILYSDFVS